MRACLARLVGELYNYRLLDSTVIFRVLHWLIPDGAGVWGNVVPVMHVGAHQEPAVGKPVMPVSRPLQHPGEPMGDSPDDLGSRAAPARRRRDTRYTRDRRTRTGPSGRPESGGGPQTPVD